MANWFKFKKMVDDLHRDFPQSFNDPVEVPKFSDSSIWKAYEAFKHRGKLIEAAVSTHEKERTGGKS